MRFAPNVLVSISSAPGGEVVAVDLPDELGLGQVQLVEVLVERDAARVEQGAHGAVGEQRPSGQAIEQRGLHGTSRRGRMGRGAPGTPSDCRRMPPVAVKLAPRRRVLPWTACAALDCGHDLPAPPARAPPPPARRLLVAPRRAPAGGAGGARSQATSSASTSSSPARRPIVPHRVPGRDDRGVRARDRRRRARAAAPTAT